MSIFFYDGTQKTPKNYIGIRIVVSVNNKVKQKWFVGEGHEKKAEALHTQWKIEQTLMRWKRNKDRTERPSKDPYFTGVSSIKMKFQRNGSSLGHVPFFIVSGSIDKCRFKQIFRIKKDGFDRAWFRACEYCAKKHKINNFDHLLKRKPDPRQFFIILKWQRQQGIDIPFERLPNEILDRENV